MNTIIDNLCNYEWKQYGLAGDMSRDDYESIAKLLSKLNSPQPTIVETGTRQGSSGALFASYIKKQNGNKFYTCDIYNVDNHGSKQDNFHVKDMFFNHMKNLDLDKYVEFHETSSVEFSKEFDDNSLDLVFIDSCHVYKYVKEDIDAWYPKIKNGGILCGHDCEILVKNDLELESLKINAEIQDDLTWDTADMLSFHYGIIVAIYEKFKDNVNLMGERIWWIQK